MVSSGQMEVLEQLKGGCHTEGGERGGTCGATDRAGHPLPSPSPALQMDVSSLYSLKFPEVAVGAGEDSTQHGAPHGDGAGDVGRATLRLLEELDRER